MCGLIGVSCEKCGCLRGGDVTGNDAGRVNNIAMFTAVVEPAGELFRWSSRAQAPWLLLSLPIRLTPTIRPTMPSSTTMPAHPSRPHMPIRMATSDKAMRSK